MTDANAGEQLAATPTNQLRQYVDGLFVGSQAVYASGWSHVQYVNGEENHTVRFSWHSSGTRIKYKNPALAIGGISCDKSYLLDEKGAWAPSEDSGHPGNEEEESDRISQFLMNTLRVSTTQPLKGLGRIALKLRSRYAR